MTTTAILATRVLAGLGAAAVLFSATVSANYDMLERREVIVTELPAAMTELQLDGTVGAISVRRAPAGTAPEARMTWKGIDEAPTADVQADGDAVRIDTTCPSGGRFIGPWGCSASVDVLVPAGVNLDVTNVTGYIELEDLDGAVTVTSRVGMVSGTGLSGPVSIQTTTGAIVLEANASEDVTVRTTTGAISVENLVAPRSVEAHAVTGAIYVAVPNDGTAYDVAGSTGAGVPAIKVPSDPNAERTIRATATTGAVNVEYSTGRGAFGGDFGMHD